MKKQTRNSKLLEDFTKYCEKHKEERFWQSLRNWINVGYIGVSNDRENWEDTFFWENKND